MSPEVKFFINDNLQLIDSNKFDEVFMSAYKIGGIKLLHEVIDVLQKAEISIVNVHLDKTEQKRIMNNFKFYPVGQGLFLYRSVSKQQLQFCI